MLTLKELKELVEKPKAGVKLPTAKALQESDVEIVVKEIMGNGAELMVYKNGFCVYQIQNRATVFPINSCNSYSYKTRKEQIFMKEQLFEQEEWYVRLMLEGEDRLFHNFCMKEKGHQVSYSAEAEEWDALSDRTNGLADYFIQQEMMEELHKVFKVLTSRQKQVVVDYFFMQKTHQQIANELGITRPAVSDAMAKALRRMKKILQK